MLNISDLTYKYGTHTVLSNINLQLEENTLAVLIGRNGSGKSTLLRCLAGWTLPPDGTIEVNGFTLRHDEVAFRKQIILVPDTPDFYDELTAWEHMQFIAQLHSIPDWQHSAQTLLENLQLFEHREDFPFTFSRGMRYKLGLAMAFLIQPPLLLLDEPFGPLDSLSSEFLWQTLKAYRQEGHSVLFSSHVLSREHQPDVFLMLSEGDIRSVTADQVESMGALLNEA